jgi:1-acyl-sn-glycerol-3-phosphate acyltransferase
VSAYYSVARFFSGVVPHLLAGCEVRGRENVPLEGGLIVASNHVSWWDPPLVGTALPRRAWFLAKVELFQNPVLGRLLAALGAIPIRRGVADLSGLARALEVLRGGQALLMFPEGSRMKDGELHPARPGVGMIAVNADVPIVPCYISGSNRPGKWWRRAAPVRIWFGGPRTWRELNGSDDLTPGRALYHRIGEAVMREIAVLREGQRQTASRGAA